jgi:hypothetical protein
MIVISVYYMQNKASSQFDQSYSFKYRRMTHSQSLKMEHLNNIDHMELLDRVRAGGSLGAYCA